MDKSKVLGLWDVGGVFLELNHMKFYKDAAEIAGISPEDFKKRYVSSTIDRDLDRGRITVAEYLTGINSLISPEIRLPRSKLEGFVETLLGKPIMANVELKRRMIEAGYSVGLFSNNNPLAVSIISRKWPEILRVSRNSPPIIFSYQVGELKPESPMYQKIPQNKYDKVILIDDRLTCIMVGVMQHGWYGIHYRGHIDSAESERTDGDRGTATTSQKLLIANSTKELEKALERFGVVLK